MPITLELTDDQALSIMAQLGSMLKKDSPPAQGTGKISERVSDAVQALPKGKIFFTAAFAKDLHLKVEQVSGSLCRAQKLKLCKMVRRGTWERI